MAQDQPEGERQEQEQAQHAVTALQPMQQQGQQPHGQVPCQGLAAWAAAGDRRRQREVMDRP